MRLVYGVGVNDANYIVQPTINGKRVKCPFYVSWQSMLERCYSEKYQQKYPSYIGCEVCKEWLTFSNFKAWMETQDWEGKELDKDILVPGNKVYSPETCMFVTNQVNSFMNEVRSNIGNCPTGVHWDKTKESFAAQIKNLGKGTKHIGYFDTPEEASLAYWKAKCSLAKQLAELQTDDRIAEALLFKYTPSKLEIL